MVLISVRLALHRHTVHDHRNADVRRCGRLVESERDVFGHLLRQVHALEVDAEVPRANVVRSAHGAVDALGLFRLQDLFVHNYPVLVRVVFVCYGFNLTRSDDLCNYFLLLFFEFFE